MDRNLNSLASGPDVEEASRSVKIIAYDLKTEFLEDSLEALEKVGTLERRKEMELILTKQAELEEACRLAYIEVDPYLQISNVVKLIETETVTRAELLKRISRAHEESLSQSRIMAEMENYIGACEEVKWLDKHKKNETTASLSIKRMERAQSLQTKLPAMLESLRFNIRSWEADTGRAFLYNGVSLLGALDDPTLLEVVKKRVAEVKVVRERKGAAEALEELRRLGLTQSSDHVEVNDKYWSFMPPAGGFGGEELLPAVDAEELERHDAAALEKLRMLVRKSRKLGEMTFLEIFRHSMAWLVSELGARLDDVDHLHAGYIESVPPFESFPSSFRLHQSNLLFCYMVSEARSSYLKLEKREDLNNAHKLRAIQQASCAFDELEHILDGLLEMLEPQRRFTLRILSASANALLRIHKLLAMDFAAPKLQTGTGTSRASPKLQTWKWMGRTSPKLRTGMVRAEYLRTLLAFSGDCPGFAEQLQEYARDEADAGGALLAAHLHFSRLCDAVFKACGCRSIQYDEATRRAKKGLCARYAKALPELEFHLEMVASHVEKLQNDNLSSQQLRKDNGMAVVDHSKLDDDFEIDEV